MKYLFYLCFRIERQTNSIKLKNIMKLTMSDLKNRNTHQTENKTPTSKPVKPRKNNNSKRSKKRK